MSLSDNFIKVLVRNDLHSAPLSLQEETIEKLLLHKKLLTKRKLSSILSTIKQKYENAKVEEGDAVGIIAAQSMGEPSTQIILRTFHYAGVAVGLVTGGLSRLEEIVNATKNIKESTMTIYIDKRHNIFNILPKVQKLHKIKFARVYGRHDEQIITTQGSNLFEVLNIKGINKKKTSTNDIRETENILGIEAARESIIQQIKGIYEEQNLDIDIRHIILLADMMTCNGTVESVGRIGIMKHKKSPLARACYEEAISNLYNASIYSEFEPFDGIIENVLPGCLVNIGTGRRDICLCLNSYGKNKKRGRKKKVL